MKIPSALSRLNEALRCLPGVGSKSAARMSLHLLQTDRAGARALAEALAHAADHIVHCATCRNFTDNEICEICRDVRRDTTLICVVETPSDLLSIEATGLYTGLYHVLLGHLSPLDGVGPHQLGLDLLEDRVKSGQVGEVIFGDQFNGGRRGYGPLHSATDEGNEYHCFVSGSRCANGWRTRLR